MTAYSSGMRIATWNVNGIRVRMPRILAWLEANAPDALLLQETKIQDGDFPHETLAEVGYRALIMGQKSYNGVAVITKEEAECVSMGFEDGIEDSQARFLAARIGGVLVATAYFPNGSSLDSDKYVYKKAWLKRLRTWIQKRVSDGELFALGGDYNIAPDPRDVAKLEKWEGGVLYNEDMHAALADLRNDGLIDVYRQLDDEDGRFSWWDYRGMAFRFNDGLRIDHIYATPELAEKATASFIDRDERKKTRCPDKSTPSDHAPVVADFDV